MFVLVDTSFCFL